MIIRKNVFHPKRRFAVLLRSPYCTLKENIADGNASTGFVLANEFNKQWVEGPYPHDTRV